MLLAGIWFHERRFKVLTGFLVLLNLVSLIAIFGDWSYATTRRNPHLAPFVTMLLSCITGVSIILAILFLGYGSLLFFQVQSIIRASAENVTATSDSSGVGYVTKDYSRLDGQGARDIGRNGGPGHSFSTRGGGVERPSSILLPATSMAGSLAAPLMPALTFANDAGTGFTPTHAHRVGTVPRRSPTNGSGEGEGERADRDPNLAMDGGSGGNGGDEEGSYEPAPMYLPPAVGGGSGLNSSPTKASGGGFAPAGTSAPVSGGAASAHYSLSGFMSPNLPIRNNNGGGGGAGGEVIAAHSYRSSVSASFTPMGSAAANTATAGGSTATGGNNSHSTESSGTLVGLPQIPSGYASSVSPEYSKLPNSSRNAANAHRALLTSPNGTTVLSAAATATGAGTPGSVTPITPTDALVGSVPYAHAAAASQHQFATPRRGTSSLARQSPAPGAAGGPGHVAASAQRQNGAYQQLQHDAVQGEDDADDSVEEVPGAPHGRVVAKSGLTNAHYYQSNGDDNGAVASVYPSVSRHGSTRGLGSSHQLRPSSDDYARHEEGRMGSTMDTTARASLLSHAVAPPPNPMRKIAVIAAICVACLIARAGLIVGMSASGHDFSAVTTVVYFVLSEVAPLFGMLKVFNTPTPLV